MFIPVHECLTACVRPLRAFSGLKRWGGLARHAELGYAEVVRYRSELKRDAAFQEHLRGCLADVSYVFPEAAELYAVVRAARPQVVVETGVAGGISSAHILRALARNGTGALFSIDLPNVQAGSRLPQGRASGWIVPEALRGAWRLELGDSRELLPGLLAELDQLDLFLHDGDHSYENMRFEFGQAYPRLGEGGLLLSDDTHLHTAWDDFCAERGLPANRVGHLGVLRKRRSL
jgi:predicted O-methyltransferase YrrM